jgi:metallo-beta-lactamase family protein
VVKIFGERYERRAEVATIGGLSAHAGQDFLAQYAFADGADLKQIFLVHGEPDAAKALTGKLNDIQSAPILYPEWGQRVEI